MADRGIDLVELRGPLVRGPLHGLAAGSHALARYLAGDAALRRRLGDRRRAPGALRGLLRRQPQRIRRARRNAGGHALDEYREPGAVLRGRAVQGRGDTRSASLTRLTSPTSAEVDTSYADPESGLRRAPRSRLRTSATTRLPVSIPSR